MDRGRSSAVDRTAVMEWRHNVRVALTYSRHLANEIATPDYHRRPRVVPLSAHLAIGLRLCVFMRARVSLHAARNDSSFDARSLTSRRPFVQPQTTTKHLCSRLFHDLLLRSYLYHCVWSVI